MHALTWFGAAITAEMRDPMIKFATRDLFLCMTLIACGVGVVVFVFRADTGELGPTLFIPSGAFMGAGIGATFHKKFHGAIVGGVIGFVCMALFNVALSRSFALEYLHDPMAKAPSAILTQNAVRGGDGALLHTGLARVELADCARA